MLDREVRSRLRTLSKDNAEIVGLHLVMTGRLIDEDPELAYQHAQAAVRRGGRVDVVREAAGLTAYRTGRFAEALRELRTVRRLNGSSEHLAVMADCERGLGRPERAITLAQSPEAEQLDPTAKVELAMVVSGARLDLGDVDGALAALTGFRVGGQTLLAARVAQAKAEALRAAGREQEAEEATAGFSAALLAQASGEVDDEDDVLLYDLEEDEEGDGAGEFGGADEHDAADDSHRADTGGGDGPELDTADPDEAEAVPVDRAGVDDAPADADADADADFGGEASGEDEASAESDGDEVSAAEPVADAADDDFYDPARDADEAPAESRHGGDDESTGAAAPAGNTEDE
ncbi:hypothetical protein [Cellulomonas denverensis]|uniref:Replicase polyprotein 1ab n=2 Tax=Cellulomonas denverensis TaxID=264297 RepID=A0A7X6QYQ0_9CELL|nr:hypothetical protein [Cellulomonas denverensis]NKY22375.1 hypothetical protein [Cellulomonas denverensis]GIG25796.1 hypothetical protein Cde04nite_20400 [Cellulomonas denverensis]